MTVGSGPAAPSLRASLRLFRLAMSAQRQQRAAASAAAAATATPIARPTTMAAFSSSVQAAASAPRPWALWRRAGAGGGTTAALLPAMAMATATAAAATVPLPSSSPPSSSSSSARHFSTAAAAAAPSIASVHLNDLHPGLGARKAIRRVGRGDGSGRGKTCGRGTKGQGARKGGGKPGLLFDGGTGQLRKWPRVHARPGSPVEYDYVNVDDVAAAARAGLLGGIDFSSSAPASSSSSAPSANGGGGGDGDALPLVTMKHLRDAGLVSKSVRWGVKLLARPDLAAAAGGGPPCRLPPMRLQVSAASASARRAVARAGGRVEAVYYNRLGLRALLKPEIWERDGRPLPRGVRAWPPRDEGRFDGVGALPPRPLAAAVGGAAAAASAPA